MDAVLYDVSDHVASLTLNRPEALNALDPAMIEALLAASRQAAADPLVRCVLLRGAGEHFMAGGDLKWFHSQTQLAGAARRQCFYAQIDAVHQAVLCLKTMSKPVVAAVRGAVAGFGLSLLLASDLALADENSYFTLAYSNIGLSPDGGASWSLPRQVGLKRAMELALLAERIDANRALELGLVNWVVPGAQLEEAARALTDRLVARPAAALARTKALLNQSLQNTLEAQLLAEQQAFADCASEADFVEGLNAFLAKRPPRFARG